MKQSLSFYAACFLLPSVVVSQSIPQGVTYQRLSVRNCDVPITAAFTSDGSTIDISYNRTVASAGQTLCIVCNKFEWKSPDYAWISSVDYEGQMDIESRFVAKIDAQIAKYAGSYVVGQNSLLTHTLSEFTHQTNVATCKANVYSLNTPWLLRHRSQGASFKFHSSRNALPEVPTGHGDLHQDSILHRTCERCL